MLTPCLRKLRQPLSPKRLAWPRSGSRTGPRMGGGGGAGGGEGGRGAEVLFHKLRSDILKHPEHGVA